ncbi:MAG: HD domain-containing protein [Bacteroidetes bacterium]|jgi:HD superfamily phosphodiesterase|nr:HD domain-containing protein [Bacteroidota bacterium]
MTLPEIISKTENLLLRQLEEFFLLTWGDTDLPSHDLEHHRRVWQYAVEVLAYGDKELHEPMFIRQLIIAVFLHDLGMQSDQRERHGYQSREMAKTFLIRNDMDPDNYENVLFAIENHDNKKYRYKDKENTLLKILSIADDLDAFGKKGIERYMEIYHARGIPEECIGPAVLENAKARFDNFRLFSEQKPSLYMKHKKRYHILRRFFEQYHK